MIAKLLSRRHKPALPPPRVPDGRRIYAIGDIHGRLDLLDGLLGRIAADDRARGARQAELIFLGDLIDRGPNSAAVIDRLMALKTERPATRFLLGNHEEVFLEVLAGDERALRFFVRIGGVETILSYGIGRRPYRDADFNDLATMLRAAVPEAHREFLADFEDMIVEGDYVFVHAGLRPGVALDEQRPKDLRWIREGFLSAGGFEKVVVHGHTIVDGIDAEAESGRPHRIALDTGAYRSGVLTAMGFEGEARWILQQRGPETAGG